MKCRLLGAGQPVLSLPTLLRISMSLKSVSPCGLSGKVKLSDRFKIVMGSGDSQPALSLQTSIRIIKHSVKMCKNLWTVRR